MNVERVERDPVTAGDESRLRPWPAWLRVPLVLLLAVGGGVVYGLHVIDTGVPFLAYVSTVPWVVIAVHPRLRGSGNFLAILLSMYVMTLIGIYWLRGHGTATWLVAPLMYIPVALLVHPIVVLVRRRWATFPLALLWPLAFTGTEWLRVLLSPGELALALLGYSQIVLTKVVQIADMFGVAGVTFALAAVAGLVADALIALTTPRGPVPIGRRFGPQVAAVVALWAGVLAYGWARDSQRTFSEGPMVHVLQNDTDRLAADVTEARRIYDLQVLQTLSTARPESEAIFWPENSILVPYGTKGVGWAEHFIPDLKALTARLGVPLLADGWIHDPATSMDVHACVFVMPDGSVQTYDKVRLLPWTEYVPLQGVLAPFGQGAVDAWLAFVKKFVGMIPRGQLGRIEDLRPMRMPLRSGGELTFGTPICFEIATARVVNRWHRQGAHFLVNQTSEGKLGDSIHEMTIAVSGFRAIEGRVSVVRATNEGISALIDPNGRVREVVRGRYTGSSINEAGVLYPTIILDSRRGTVYSRIGDAFAIACLLISVGLAVVGGVTRALRMRRAAHDAGAPIAVPAPS